MKLILSLLKLTVFHLRNIEARAAITHPERTLPHFAPSSGVIWALLAFWGGDEMRPSADSQTDSQTGWVTWHSKPPAEMCLKHPEMYAEMIGLCLHKRKNRYKKGKN